MLRNSVIAILVAFFVVSASNAAGSSLEVLDATTPWAMNYEKESCSLLRSFGTGPDQVTIRLMRFAPDAGFEMVLYGNRFRSFSIGAGLYYDFGLTGKWSPIYALLGKSGDLTMLDTVMPGFGAPSLHISKSQPSPDVEAEARQAEAIHEVKLRLNDGKPFKLALGSMAAPMKAMRACTDDLVQKWGFDLAEQTHLSRQAKPGNELVKWLDYSPSVVQGFRSGHSGPTRYRLDIGADGKVTACYITNDSSPDFSKALCEIVMKRSRFLPALDAAGKPVKSFYTDGVDWVRLK